MFSCFTILYILFPITPLILCTKIMPLSSEKKKKIRKWDRKLTQIFYINYKNMHLACYSFAVQRLNSVGVVKWQQSLSGLSNDSNLCRGCQMNSVNLQLNNNLFLEITGQFWTYVCLRMLYIIGMRDYNWKARLY